MRLRRLKICNEGKTTMTLKKYDCGVNLGGWISQYKYFDEHHFESFITESDIEQIAGWGMDHVRLPVDYPVLESDEQPFVYREQGLKYIDQCLEWCWERNLGLVLDLHKAPGYSFTDTLEAGDATRNTLFSGGKGQDRFIELWEMLAQRYLHLREGLAFELLNEVVLTDSKPWNELILKTLAAIRAIDPDRAVVIGGNHYNAAAELQNLVLVDDPNVIYTFHFYEPMMFTHQKAGWVAPAVRYNQELEYPGQLIGLGSFLKQYPEFNPLFSGLVDAYMDRTLLKQYLKQALDFQAQTGKKLYCGEFGVIESAPMESQIRWLRDFTGLLRENHIGYAVWSYKQMDFGLVNHAGQVVNEKLLKRVVGA
jgi:endoglucanase